MTNPQTVSSPPPEDDGEEITPHIPVPEGTYANLLMTPPPAAIEELLPTEQEIEPPETERFILDAGSSLFIGHFGAPPPAIPFNLPPTLDTHVVLAPSPDITATTNYTSMPLDTPEETQPTDEAPQFREQVCHILGIPHVPWTLVMTHLRVRLADIDRIRKFSSELPVRSGAAPSGTWETLTEFRQMMVDTLRYYQQLAEQGENILAERGNQIRELERQNLRYQESERQHRQRRLQAERQYNNLVTRYERLRRESQGQASKPDAEVQQSRPTPASTDDQTFDITEFIDTIQRARQNETRAQGNIARDPLE